MKRFFTLFGIFALIFAACENESSAPNEELTPEISVSPSGIVTMPVAGGEVELSFQIINPSEGAKLEATADSEWITNLSVDEKVRFSVERNHSDQQRIGIVTLSYSNAEALSIAIQQNEALASGDVRISITSERKTIFEASAWNSENFKLIAIISSPNEEFDNRYEVINSAMCEIDGAKAHEYKTK